MRTKEQILEDFQELGPDSLELTNDPDIQNTFMDAFFETAVGQEMQAEGYWTKANMNFIAEHAKNSEGIVSWASFCFAASQLFLIGDLAKKPKPVAKVAPEVVEKDSLGRPITEAQRRYSEYLAWSNNPETSAAMIAQRRRSDPKYAQFYSEQSALERAGGVGDAVVAVGTEAVRSDTSIKRTESLKLFARQYATTPASEIKRLSSPAGNPHAWHNYKDTVDACIAAGLI